MAVPDANILKAFRWMVFSLIILTSPSRDNMEKLTGHLYLAAFVGVVFVRSEKAGWCRSKSGSLEGVPALAYTYARSRIQCVQMCVRYDSPWPCYTAQYDGGHCTLYGQSTRPECCSGNGTGTYITKKLELLTWPPLFRAYNGSGLPVYKTWISNNSYPRREEGASPLLSQPDVWNMMKQLKFSFYVNETEVAFVTFNATATTRTDWFSQARIVDSTYSSIMESRYASTISYSFSVAGHVNTRKNTYRRFYAVWRHRLCLGDKGWLFVSDETTGNCSYEEYSFHPLFFYCKGSAPCANKAMNLAEKLVISALF